MIRAAQVLRIPTSQHEGFVAGLIGEEPACEHCPCAGQRIVPPEGNLQARLAFVGEGPGYDEEQCGLPFRGRSGRLFDQVLDAAGVSRADVWVDNAALCVPRPRRVVRDGKAVYIEADAVKQASRLWCSVRLLSGLVRLRPAAVIPLGRLAYHSVVGRDRSIVEFRGAVHVGVDLAARLAAARKELEAALEGGREAASRRRAAGGGHGAHASGDAPSPGAPHRALEAPT